MNWIPFDQASPVEPEEYLVTNGTSVTTLTFDGKDWLFEAGLPFPVPMQQGVHLTFTHWMPLPEPPKPQSANQPTKLTPEHYQHLQTTLEFISKNKDGLITIEGMLFPAHFCRAGLMFMRDMVLVALKPFGMPHES